MVILHSYVSLPEGTLKTFSANDWVIFELDRPSYDNFLAATQVAACRGQETGGSLVVREATSR